MLGKIEKFLKETFQFDRVNIQTKVLNNLLLNELGIIKAWIKTPQEVPARGGGAGRFPLQYLDDTKLSFGNYLDRNNKILLSFNLDLLYEPHETEGVMLQANGLQIIPGFSLVFNTPVAKIGWNVGFLHIDEFFIPDNSITISWSLKSLFRERNKDDKRVRGNEQFKISEDEQFIFYAED